MMGMTLDEAIKHEEKVSIEVLEKTEGRNASDPIAIKCGECAEKHRQLAEWLKELRAFRKQAKLGFRSVTCATCAHLDTREMQGQETPVYFCRKNIWENKHDPYLPIRCLRWKVKSESEEE